MIKWYYCSSCDFEFSVVIHTNMPYPVLCPRCHSRHKQHRPIRKPLYFLNHPTGFYVFNDKHEKKVFKKLEVKI